MPGQSRKAMRTFAHVGAPALIGVALFVVRQTMFSDVGGVASGTTTEHSLGLTLLLASPSGFAVYAATSFFLRVWPHGSIGNKALWIAVAPSIAVGVEVGQAAGVIPGAFGPLDLMTSVVGTCLSLIAGTWSREGGAALGQALASDD